MTSEKQLLANRANALKSTGPVTGAGRQIASRNAFKHGITAQTILMSPEEHARHEAFIAEYTAALKPDNIVERDLAESIAEASWRLKRAAAMDHNIYALADAAPPADEDAPEPAGGEAATALARTQAFLDHIRQFQLLTTYENRIRRNMQKDIDRLERLQSERRQAYAKARTEAFLLSQLANAQGKIYDPLEDYPDENGFVFSVNEINAGILRERRVEKASDARDESYRAEALEIEYVPDLIDLPVAA